MVFLRMSDNPNKMLLYVDNWDALGAIVETTRFWARWGPIIVMIILAFGIVVGNWIDRAISRQNSGSYFFVFCFGVIFLYLARVAYVYFLLFSFKCPRCRNRWSGLLNKAQLCEFCGLRLHQDS
jgi:MFS-type transporter involved in bile tolerance (Atg22 family)